MKQALIILAALAVFPANRALGAGDELAEISIVSVKQSETSFPVPPEPGKDAGSAEGAEAYPPLPGQPAVSAPGSGGMSKTCAGKVLDCIGGSCTLRPFSIYASQSAYFNADGSLSFETHAFQLGGALSQHGDPQPLGIAGDWFLYRGERFTLAVPWRPEYPVYAIQHILAEQARTAAWQELCR